MGSLNNPFFPGGDGELYFNEAKYIYDSGSLLAYKDLESNYMGFQVVLAWIFQIFGLNVFNGIAFNYLLLLLIIILITTIILEKTNSTKKASYVMLSFMFSNHLVQFGTILLKDIVVCFGVTLFLYSIIKTPTNKLKILKYIFYAGIAIFLVGITRLQVVVLLLLIFVMLRISSLRQFLVGVLMAAVFFFFMLPIFSTFTTTNFDSESLESSLVKNQVIELSLQVSNDGVVAALLSDYSSWSILKKIYYLPVSFFVQYVTPFNFWQMNFIDGHSWLFVSNQLMLIWDLFIGVFFIFLIFNVRSLPIDSFFKKLFFIGLLYFIFIGFITGGTIPRYFVPSLILILPAIGLCWSEYHTNYLIKKKLKSFFFKYYLFILLIACCYLIFKIY